MFNQKEYYVYILKCSDETLYTGITNNLEKRISMHNSGNGAKYTKTRTPVKCVYFERGYTKSQALKREIEIKKMRRKDKLIIIEKGENYGDN